MDKVCHWFDVGGSNAVQYMHSLPACLCLVTEVNGHTSSWDQFRQSTLNPEHSVRYFHKPNHSILENYFPMTIFSFLNNLKGIAESSAFVRHINSSSPGTWKSRYVTQAPVGLLVETPGEIKVKELG